MRKPIIGIAGTLYYESDPSFIGVPFDFNSNYYSQCITKAGGIPLYLPVINDVSVIEGQLEAIDGLLLPGGGDIKPLFYDSLPQPLQGKSFEQVDSFQIHLTQKALEGNKSILGICRGIQTLNVSAGGTLYQDVSYANPKHIQHKQQSFLSNLAHPVQLKPKSILYDILGSEYVVNSLHHQCVQDVAPTFRVTAVAPDGIIEGIQMKCREFVVGVQWHLEMMALTDPKMLQLFKQFVASSKY